MSASVRSLCGSRACHLVGSRCIATTSAHAALVFPRVSRSSHVIKEPSVVRHIRLLSSAAAASPAPAVSEVAKDKMDKKKDNSNIFLDNLGTIFLLSIAGVVLALVRSSFGSSKKAKLRDQLEMDAELDPLEIDDLRVANGELTPDVFRSIMSRLSQDFPQGTAKYEDFVFSTRKTMRSLKGEAFTVEMGHLMDRAVGSALKKHGKSKDDEISIVFFLTALSLAMDIDSSVSERIRVLYSVLQLKDSTVAVQDIIEMVGYLQDTFQLTPDTQVVMAEAKFPVQQYNVASPEELVAWDGPANEQIDVQAFAEILRSKSVCAWGECYFKKKAKV
jgi:hypothetical protein